MAVALQQDSPLAAELSNLVQPKLVDLGWSTGGPDDSALAEYIILMLSSGKTKDEIASELSNDLLSLGPEDQGATDFATWLFQQLEALQNAGGSQPGQENTTQAIPSFTGDQMSGQHTGDGNLQDAEMGDANDGATGSNIPTGPKFMRNGKPNSKRMMGQINRAMDRTNDSSLHRVRSHGQERINSHGRQPPKGPRAAGVNRFNGGVPTGPSRGGGAGRGHGGMNGGLNMSHQQQNQLMQMMEQQAKMMSSILNPQQQQAFMSGMNAPAINPNFHGNQQGRSLFDRVQKTGGHHGRHQNKNGPPTKNQDAEMGEDTIMDVEGGQSTELGPDTVCKFNLKCTKADCIFAHQSPAAPAGASIDVNDHCSFGAACQNRKCVARHPSPAQRKNHQAEQDCKFYPNCTNPNCSFRHPDMPPCRFGSECTRSDCKFTHVQTKCKYTPCLNPNCVYKHEEGQKRSAVWTADGGSKEHVSERKFVGDVSGEEELVTAEMGDAGPEEAAGDADIVS